MSKRGVLGSLIFLFSVLLVGTFGYMVIERATPLDSAYMTVITLATVGFQEVMPLSQSGKIFTMALILVGVGAVGYTFTQVATFLIGGDLQNALKGRQMEKTIQRYRDHIVVCGFGRIGRMVAENLAETGEQVVVVDKEHLDRIESYAYLVGDATEDAVLEAAGIRHARGLAACLPSDADNLFVTLSAKSIRSDIKVAARAIASENAAKLRRAGADEVISVHDISARRIASVLVRPHLVNLVDIIAGNREMVLELSEIQVADNPKLSGKSISEVNLKRNTGALILAVRRGDGTTMFNPDSDYRFSGDDTMVVMGEAEQIRKVDQLFV